MESLLNWSLNRDRKRGEQAAGDRYQAMANAGALNAQYTAPPPPPPTSFLSNLFGRGGRPAVPSAPQPDGSLWKYAGAMNGYPIAPVTRPAVPAAPAPQVNPSQPAGSYWEQAMAARGTPMVPTTKGRMTADYLKRAREVLSKTVPYAMLTGNNPQVLARTTVQAAVGQEVAPQQPGVLRNAYLGTQSLASGATFGLVQQDEGRTPLERGVQMGSNVAGSLLPALLTGGVSEGVTGAAAIGLTRAAPRLAETAVGRILPRVIGNAAQGAVMGAGRVGVEALTNPGQMTAGRAAREIGSEALSWGVMGGASETAGNAARGALIRLLPKAAAVGKLTPAVRRAMIAAGGGLATGTTVAAVDTALRYLANPKQFDRDQAAGDIVKQAAFFAGLDTLMSLAHGPGAFTADLAARPVQPGEMPRLDAYEFLTGTRNPAREGLTEWQPGSGLWLDPKTHMPVLREVARVTADGGKVYKLDEWRAAQRGEQAAPRYDTQKGYVNESFVPGAEPAPQQPIEMGAPKPVQPAPAPAAAQTTEPASPTKPTRLEGWNSPVIKGMEKKAALQSGTLPEGIFIALDQPFESDAHDAKRAQRVSVDVQNPFDPDGLLDPANAEAHGAIGQELSDAIRTSGVLQSASATANGDPLAISGAIRRFSTDYLRQRGFDSYVRAIDGDPKNRELIVFDKSAVKRKAQAPAPKKAEAPGPSPVVPAQAGQGQIAGGIFPHFTTPEGKVALEAGQPFDTSKLPQHGTGDLGLGPKTGRMMGPRLYLSLNNQRWGKVTRSTGEGQIVPATDENSKQGEPFYDYDKQQWMVKIGGSEEAQLSPVNYQIDPNAHVLTIDSPKTLDKALAEAAQIMGTKERIYWDQERTWDALAKKYDVVAIRNVEKNIQENDNKFFRAADADQLVVLNQDAAKVVRPSTAAEPAAKTVSPESEKVAAMPAPLGPLNEVARGSEVTAETERGTKVQLHYAVAEASDLVASHDTGLSRNPDYPAELQPRDRGRIASEEQVGRIAGRLNPARLGDSPMVSDGAPVVGPDGVVESGNGRVIALQRIYEQGHENAGKYRQWLADNAEKFGLDKAATEQAQNPVLVRVRDTEVDRVKFTQEANEQAVASMSATEKAQNDSRRLTGPLMALFTPSETGEIDTPANRDFIRGFMGQVVGDAERGEYVRADGSISQAGVLRIRNAIFAKAYGNITTVEKLAESTDNNVRTMTNAMLIAAPRLAAVKEGIVGGRLHDLDITDDLTAAVNKVSALRKAGRSVKEYLDDPQTSLLQPDLSAFGRDLLDVVDRNGRSAKRLSAILLAYADAVEAAGDPRYGGDLLGRMAPTRAEVLTVALRKVELGSEGQTSILEGEAAGRSPAGAGPMEVSEGPARARSLVVHAGNGDALRSALDTQGEIRVGLDNITINPDARVSADVAQAVKNAARGWDVVRNSDGGVTLRRPQGGFSATAVREVEAFYKRVGVREGEDSKKAQRLAIQAVSDINHTLRAGLRTVAEGVAGFGGVQSGIRTLGVGIRAELTHRGRVEFRGKKVTTARQLAVLAQIVRNPQFEVFRIFYVKNGVIVANEAISSRLPANSNAFLGKPKDAIDQMKDRMKRLGADGYWLLHNHPSGRPLPSNEDIELTRGFAKELPGFKGHVVINSKKYGVLDSKHHLMPIIEDLPDKIAAKPDELLSPSLAHPLLGATLGNQLDVAVIGQQLKTPENYVTLLYRSADAKVRAIQQVPVGVFNYETAAADYLRGRQREFGAAGVLAYYDGPKDLTATARKLIVNNALIDFVTPGGKSTRAPILDKIDPNMTAGRPDKSIRTVRVTEDQVDYTVGPEFFLDESARAETGGVEAFAGARPERSAPEGPAPMKPMQRKALIAWLGKQFDVTLAKGHFNQHALGIYKVKPEVIRTRAWGDLYVLGHEIGHHLDKQLGLRGIGYQDELLALAEPVSRKSYTVDQRLGEGVAEFLRLYLGDPAEARQKAPGFYHAFETRLESEPELAKVISDAQDQFAAQLRATPDEEIDAATSWNNRQAPMGQRIRSVPGAIERAKNWIVDEWFDSNDAVRRIQEKIAGKGELPVEMDAYLRLNVLPKLIPGKVEAKLRQWSEAMAPLGQRAEDYFRYADARAVLWRSKQFGYDSSKLAFSRQAAEAKIRQVEAGPDAQLYKDTFEKEQRLFHKSLLELKDAGVLNAEAIARIEGAHEDYVPLFRDIEAKNRGTAGAGRTTVSLPAGVLRQKGGAEPHMDPVERRIRYFARVTGIAERNRVGVALSKFAEAFEGAGKLMDRIPPPLEMVKVKNEDIMGALEDMGLDTSDLDPMDTISFFRPSWANGKRDTIITIYRGGKPYYYDLHDPAVFRAMAAVDPVTANLAARFGSWFAGTFRSGATITPSFSVANLIRDTWESFAFSKHQVVPGHALFEALRLAATKDPFIQRVIDSGLKQGGWLRPERQSVAMLQEIAGGKRINLTRRGLWHLYQQVREQPEFWTRLGEASLDYRARLKAGASDEEAFLRGLSEGGRITLNFTRGGYTARAINRYVPFFKIPFEAAYRVTEAAREHPGVFLLKLLPFVAWGVATAVLNHDNKQYDEASDYERDRYMLLPWEKALVRVPKANGVFAIIQNTAERAMRQWKADDPHAWDNFAKDALNELTPRLSNPVLELIVAAATGQSLDSDFPILTESDKNLPPEMQYDSNTSLLARGIAKVGVLGKSPKMAQHDIETVIPGYSQGLFGLENFLRRLTGAGGGKPAAARPEDWPVVGRFISRPGEGKQGRSISVFYDEKDAADKAYAGLKRTVEQAAGWPEGASYTVTDTGVKAKGKFTPAQFKALQAELTHLRKDDPDQFKLITRRPTYNKVADMLSDLRRKRKEAEESKTLSPAAKRRAIEGFNLQMTNLVRKAYGKDLMND